MTLQDVMQAVLPRLREAAGVDIFQSANAALRNIGKRLAARRSDLVKGAFSLDFPAGPSMDLPADVVGLAEDPYAVIGLTTIFLSPLRSQDRADLDKEGSPRCYELLGRQLCLLPYPAEPIVVKGMGYSLPERLTALDDVVPWSGVLDELVIEAVCRVASMGLAHAVDPVFQAFVSQELDRLLPVRSARPRRAAGYHY